VLNDPPAVFDHRRSPAMFGMISVAWVAQLPLVVFGAMWVVAHSWCVQKMPGSVGSGLTVL
jgi:hypothetical protein